MTGKSYWPARSVLGALGGRNWGFGGSDGPGLPAEGMPASLGLQGVVTGHYRLGPATTAGRLLPRQHCMILSRFFTCDPMTR